MNDQDLNKVLTRFFKDQNLQPSVLIRLKDHLNNYQQKKQQVRIVKKIFQMASKQMKKDNLKKIIPRTVRLVKEIIQSEEYREVVSHQIVDLVINMLQSVFKNNMMDLFTEVKLYRKIWAKLITDQAYNLINTQAIKQLKIDLDRGFTPQMRQKLKSEYKRRGFTKAEKKKYLPPKIQSNLDVKKGQQMRSDSESQREEEKPRKKVKKESAERGAERRSVEHNNSDMVMGRHSSFIPSNSNNFGNSLGIDPRSRPNEPVMYPPQIQNMYSPNPYFPPPPPPNRVTYSSIGQYGPPGYYIPNNYPNSYGYPPNYRPAAGYGPATGFDPYKDSRYNIQNHTRPVSSYNRILQKIGSMKSSWFYECKFCGLLISTNQKYDQHMFNHFSQSQKQYEISHSRTEHQKKAHKGLMPSTQEWIESNRIKINQQKFVVPIKGGVSADIQNCIICRGQLKITWSDDIQSWVYEDAVRTKNTDSSKSICHVDCFQAIDEFERSSDEFVR